MTTEQLKTIVPLSLPLLAAAGLACAHSVQRLDLGTTAGANVEPDLVRLSNDGIQRYVLYYNWRELEESPGVYRFDHLDAEVAAIQAAGMVATLEIELADVSCTLAPEGSPQPTDAQCLAGHLPNGVPFSRQVNRFDDPEITTLLSRLVRAVIERYAHRRVISHLFLGNETDSYLRVARATGQDLFPSFVNLIRRVQEEVASLPSPRPKFGTVLTFFAPFAEYEPWQRQMASAVEVMGFTVYPTDPDFGETDPIAQRIPRWLDRMQEVAQGRPVAITEIGASAEEPFGGIDHQREFAEAVVDYLKRNAAERPGSIEFASWFSLHGYPPESGMPFFMGMGLRTLSDEERPAYRVWAGQGGP